MIFTLFLSAVKVSRVGSRSLAYRVAWNYRIGQRLRRSQVASLITKTRQIGLQCNASRYCRYLKTSRNR